MVVWALFADSPAPWWSAPRYIFLEALVVAAATPFVFYLLRLGQGYLEEVENAS